MPGPLTEKFTVLSPEALAEPLIETAFPSKLSGEANVLAFEIPASALVFALAVQLLSDFLLSSFCQRDDVYELRDVF